MNDVRRGLVGAVVSPNARIIEAFRILFKAAERESTINGGLLADVDAMKVTPVGDDPRLPRSHTVSMSFSMSVPETEVHLERGVE